MFLHLLPRSHSAPTIPMSCLGNARSPVMWTSQVNILDPPVLRIHWDSHVKDNNAKDTNPEDSHVKDTNVEDTGSDRTPQDTPYRGVSGGGPVEATWAG